MKGIGYAFFAFGCYGWKAVYAIHVPYLTNVYNKTELVVF